MNLNWKDLASFHIAEYIIQGFLKNGSFFSFNRETNNNSLTRMAE